MDSLTKLYQVMNGYWGRYTEVNDGETPYEVTIQLIDKHEFEDAQLGYRIDEEGNILINSESDWQKEWYVIGMEEELGDPIVVDVSKDTLPVFKIMHDAEWTPVYLADSLESLLKKF